MPSTQRVAAASPDPRRSEASQARPILLARRQHGLVTVDQLHDLGLTRRQIRTRTSRGEWTPAAVGVLRVGGAPVTWESEVMAHLFAAGRGAVASHRTAAVLWGLDGHRPGRPEITVPRGRNFWPAGVRVHVSTDLHLARPVSRSGIATTSLPRTLLDLAAVLPQDAVHLAIEDARRRRLTDWEALLATLVAHARRGRRGVATVRAILDEHHQEIETTGSGFERLVATALTQAGLPAPRMQHPVEVDDRRYRLDLAYPGAMVGIELDGSKHLERHVWEADHARQNMLVLAGWTILRFTWWDYLRRRSNLIQEVRAALDATH